MANITELALQKGVTHFIITMTFTPYVPATNLVPLVAGSKVGVQLDIGKLEENYGNLCY